MQYDYGRCEGARAIPDTFYPIEKLREFTHIGVVKTMLRTVIDLAGRQGLYAGLCAFRKDKFEPDDGRRQGKSDLFFRRRKMEFWVVCIRWK